MKPTLYCEENQPEPWGWFLHTSDWRYLGSAGLSTWPLFFKTPEAAAKYATKLGYDVAFKGGGK